MAAIFATILQIPLSAHYHLCGLGPAAGTGRLHHLVPRAWLGDLWFLKEEEAGVGFSLGREKGTEQEPGKKFTRK